MQLLVFVLAYPLIWIISILPFKLVYALSDFIFFIVYTVLGYRKKIVYANLSLVFPEKSSKELKEIQRIFYGHLCDTFLEMIKTMNISKEDIKNRYHITNLEVLHELEKTKSILIVCSHYANWEWNVSINNYVKSEGYAIYQKIKNKYFDHWVKSTRARFNTTLITQEETVRTVVKNHKDKVPSIYGMVSDQSPQAHRAPYWTEFMGIKVPVFSGPETMARKMDLAVVFLKVSKVKRGYYEAAFIPITTAGKSTAEHEITDTFLRLTEQQIRENPPYYLWTHRRWKHRNKADTQ
ncbi:lysophospholipid acyltransferase family protein [Cellulophaga sp. Hel_I_12]|uniref:lysophospholipid acyltransferase family protein n=1 Tax=Cellulophaga sp. Hel_I_12 TaxID=1249972 RepID=UPI00064568FC|nr:lysophospholipid acyltransferase family protein [Cellulophaga sp. Hel_I_12]